MHDTNEHTEERTSEPTLDATVDAVAFLGETLGPLFLYEPTEAAVLPIYGALRNLENTAASEWPFADATEAQRALELIAQGLAPTADGVDDPDDALLWEYRRLFVGPAKKAAPPWGSVYTDRECVVFGVTTLELRQWMRSKGISRPDHDGGPEDHIGLMLLLMAWIARNRPELLDEYLAEHFLTWAPHFLEIVQRESTHPFFEGLALLTRASALGVQDARGLEVAVPHFYR